MHFSSKNRIFRLLKSLLNPGNIAWLLVLLLYFLIFWSINKGISIDEGFYLLGYLKNQQIGYFFSDFHYIVKTLFYPITEDNVLFLRILRVVLTILVLYLFIYSSYKWLITRYKSPVQKSMFYSFGFLAGTLCFSYASNVFYYDNIQLFFYLVSLFLFFIYSITASKVIKSSLLLLVGFIIAFALTNYFFSGIFLFLIFVSLLVINDHKSIKDIIIKCSTIVLGLIIGIIIYSLFIRNWFDFFEDAFWTINNFSKSERSKYNYSGQISILIKYLINFAKVYLPVIILLSIYLSLIYTKILKRVILNLVFGVILVFLTYNYSKYFSNILLLPILLLFIDSYIVILLEKTKPFFTSNITIMLILIATPLLAILGTDQRLEMKMVYYMPWWALAYFIILEEFKQYINSKRIKVYHYTFIITFTIVFLSQGFLKHIHYNYSIKRSTYYIKNAERLKNIGVSEYQQKFYENGISELKKAGFTKGDEILAFYETFMLVYVAGGYIPNQLLYSAKSFVSDDDNIPQNKVKYIIIDESQISMIEEFLSQTDWDFPKSYNQSQLGTDGHNLTQLGYHYILFSSMD